jgi:hypothetical protein
MHACGRSQRQSVYVCMYLALFFNMPIVSSYTYILILNGLQAQNQQKLKIQQEYWRPASYIFSSVSLKA